MKKLYPALFFFALLTIAGPVQAQDDASVNVEQTRKLKGNFHLGITTAVNNTWIKVDNEQENNEHYTYNTTFKWAPIGIVAGYKFNDRQDLQAEAYLSNQGQNYNITDDNGNTVGEKTIKLTYLQVPLLWKFMTGDATRFTLHFGPQAGFLIKGEEVNRLDKTTTVTIPGPSTKTIQAGTYTLAKKEKGDPLDERVGGLNAVDPSVVLGFGLEKDVKDNLYLSGSLRFNYGFKDFRDTESTRDQYDFDHHILRYNIFGGVQVGLHYVFR